METLGNKKTLDIYVENFVYFYVIFCNITVFIYFYVGDLSVFHGIFYTIDSLCIFM